MVDITYYVAMPFLSDDDGLATHRLCSADVIYVRVAVDKVGDRLVTHFGDCLRNVRRVAWRRIDNHDAAIVNKKH